MRGWTSRAGGVFCDPHNPVPAHRPEQDRLTDHVSPPATPSCHMKSSAVSLPALMALRAAVWSGTPASVWVSRTRCQDAGTCAEGVFVQTAGAGAQQRQNHQAAGPSDLGRRASDSSWALSVSVRTTESPEPRGQWRTPCQSLPGQLEPPWKVGRHDHRCPSANSRPGSPEERKEGSPLPSVRRLHVGPQDPLLLQGLLADPHPQGF